jgi:DNA mismatch repair protein MutH
MDLDYQRDSIESIVKHAAGLTGHSLVDFFPEMQDADNIKQKGQLGNLVEKYFFQLPINSHSSPDFQEAGLELKVTGVTQKGPGKFAAKERLVLTMIDFNKLVKEDWNNCHLRDKCGTMLILFYLFDSNLESFRRRFVLNPLIYRIDGADQAIIQRDWELIRGKVAQGLAHELSEGDTLYLGACRKGSGGPNEALRSQPFAEIPARARAFALKQSYLNNLIEGTMEGEVSVMERGKYNLEEVTETRFKPYIGWAVQDIAKSLDLEMTIPRAKSFNSTLVKRVLGNGANSVTELKKADIQIKTIRLGSNNKPKEAMSFRSFNFIDIAHQVWEESDFLDDLEKRFLLVIFRIDADGVEKLVGVRYWNMPFSDREQARRVWEITVSRIRQSRSDFPKAIENPVAHVRPKARNAADANPLPNGIPYTKQCFWLNKRYIESVIKAIADKSH